MQLEQTLRPTSNTESPAPNTHTHRVAAANWWLPRLEIPARIPGARRPGSSTYTRCPPPAGLAWLPDWPSACDTHTHTHIRSLSVFISWCVGDTSLLQINHYFCPGSEQPNYSIGLFSVMEPEAVVTVLEWVLMVVQLGKCQKEIIPKNETPMVPSGHRRAGRKFLRHTNTSWSKPGTDYKCKITPVPRHGHVPPVGAALANKTPGTQSQVTFVSTKWLPCILGAGNRGRK